MVKSAICKEILCGGRLEVRWFKNFVINEKKLGNVLLFLSERLDGL